jgi:hypothetical protein
MQPLPHHYNVTVAAHEKGPTEITSPGLNPLISAPPREFDGPGNCGHLKHSSSRLSLTAWF